MKPLKMKNMVYESKNTVVGIKNRLETEKKRLVNLKTKQYKLSKI